MTHNAKRYQFLRDRFALESINDEADFAALAHLNGDEFDAALDAAMARAGFEVAQEVEPVAWSVTVGDDFKNCIEITHCKEDAVAEYERAIAGGFESIYRIRPLFAAPQALNAEREYLQPADLGDLMRFQETTDDSQGYDISKTSIKRLAELGVVQSHGFGTYGITAFGHFALESMFSQKPSLPLMTNDDRDREAIQKAEGAKP